MIHYSFFGTNFESFGPLNNFQTHGQYLMQYNQIIMKIVLFLSIKYLKNKKIEDKKEKYMRQITCLRIVS